MAGKPPPAVLRTLPSHPLSVTIPQAHLEKCHKALVSHAPEKRRPEMNIMDEWMDRYWTQKKKEGGAWGHSMELPRVLGGVVDRAPYCQVPQTFWRAYESWVKGTNIFGSLDLVGKIKLFRKCGGIVLWGSGSTEVWSRYPDSYLWLHSCSL